MALQDCFDLPRLGDAQPAGVGEGQAEQAAGLVPVARGGAIQEVEGKVGAGDQKFADVTEPLQGGELFLLADAQGLVDLTAGVEDVGDLALADGDFADIAEAAVDGELFLLADAQGLVELTAGLEDVGDLALGDGDGADIAEAAVDGELFLLADAQGLVELAAPVEPAGPGVEEGQGVGGRGVRGGAQAGDGAASRASARGPSPLLAAAARAAASRGRGGGWLAFSSWVRVASARRAAAG